MANELLEEALRVRRCPGMVFADGPGGRRPRIAGTGIDIWEVIAAYHSVGNSLARLRRSYHWLSEVQLRTALGYYKLYREETERWIKRNESLTLEALAESHPTLLTDLE
ncbi:MAG TPA: DUF433 domain-containing protein [Planctomycetota bacterium]|nr:DUF433 domain-containing protein [Planctomycetota bacterium]